MNEWLILVAIFSTVSGVMLLVLLRVNHAYASSSGVSTDDPTPVGKAPPAYFGSLTKALAGLVPMSSSGQQSVQKELLRAGYYHPTALIDYAAIRAYLTILPLVVTGMAILLIDNQQYANYTLFYGLLAAVLGFSLPRSVIQIQGRNRSRRILQGLPMLLDSLVLCMTGGGGLQGALRHVGDQIKRAAPELASEIGILRDQTRLRSLSYALQKFADRVQVPEIRSLAFLLSQSEKLGTDATAPLNELAEHFRTNMKQEAEGQANRTSFWMLFPTILCLFTATAILIVGPLGLQLIKESKEGQQLLKEVEKQKDRARFPKELVP